MKDSRFFEEILPFTRLLEQHRFCLPNTTCEKGIRFFATSAASFRAKYTHFHLAKILNAFSVFEKKIEAADNKEDKSTQEVHFRILKTVTSENGSLGIAVVLKLSTAAEFLSKERLLQAILHIVPGVACTPNTTYYFRDELSGILFLYQEIEKKRERLHTF